MPGPPSRLFNRNLFLLWQGQTISQLGAQVFGVAILLWVKHATGSATIMGSMLMVSGAVAVLLGPVAGTVVDRTSRRAILVVSDLVLGIASLALFGLIRAAPTATSAITAALFAVSLTNGVASAFFNPAISAAIPDLVPRDKVAAANSLAQSSLQLCTFAGQALGGTLFRLLGAPLLILFDGLSYLFAAASESFVAIPRPPPREAKHWRQQLAAFRSELVDGFRYVWRCGGLRDMVIGSAALNFFTAPVVVLLPFYVEDFLGTTTDWVGFILAAYGVGSLAGFLFAGASRLSGKARVRLMVGFMLGQSAGFMLLGVTRSQEAALVLALIGGFGAGLIQVIVTTVLQLSTPSEMRGRVFALLGAISGSLAPIAMGLTGVVADLLHHDVPFIYVVCGAGALGVSTLVALSRAFRQYLASGETADVAPAAKQVAPIR